MPIQHDGNAHDVNVHMRAGINERHHVTGRTPLHEAVMLNNMTTVRLLLDAGADANAGHTSQVRNTAWSQHRLFECGSWECSEIGICQCRLCSFSLRLNIHWPACMQIVVQTSCLSMGWNLKCT
jgi:hypothetical protein